MSKANTTQLTPREQLQNKFRSARTNLLIVVAFTLINIIALFSDGSYYFLFSLFVPYFLAMASVIIRIPELFTPAEWATISQLPDFVLNIPLIIAAIILLVFLACWFFSKKKIGWITAALVLVCVDTVLYVLLGFNLEDVTGFLVDLAFHAWVIVSLVGGISAHKKLQTLPPEDAPIDTTGEVVETTPEAIEESTDAPITATEETAE